MKNLASYTKYISNIKSNSKNINEPEWFLAHRLNALKHLEDLNYPVIERLDYSSWNLWSIPNFKNLLSSNIQTNEDSRVSTFQEAILKDQELFKKIYEQSDFIQNHDFFDSFTTTFLTNGIFIYIPDNINNSKAIELDHILDLAVQKHNNYQVLIYIGNNSSVKIIERYTNHPQKVMGTLNMNIQVIAAEGAQVEYSVLGKLENNVNAFIRRNGKTQRNAKINWYLGALNNGNVLEDIQISLDGEGSSSEVKAIALSHGIQVQVINAKILNKKAHTEGNIFQHGVVLDESTLTFNGIGQILRKAKNSDAQQESRVLLLSDEARADTNPILLIDEYEIVAGHAASITRTNEEQLYYLMSRGLSQKEAEKLIIRGFLDIVLAEMPEEKIKKDLLKQIERKLSYYVN